MKYAVFIIVGLVTSGCGKPGVIDPETVSYVNSFQDASQRVGKALTIANSGVSVNFGVVDHVGETGAMCDQNSNSVIIDKASWDQMSVDQRKQVIYHELGHCVLHRDHDNSKDEATNCHVSLMSSSSVVDSCINALGWAHYENELFN